MIQRRAYGLRNEEYSGSGFSPACCRNRSIGDHTYESLRASCCAEAPVAIPLNQNET